MSKSYQWPLSDSNFTFLDRLKICKFFLDPKRQWTEGKEVRKFQEIWAKHCNTQYAVMTSSGSTANTLIAEYIKDKNKFSPHRTKIVTQPLGWMTSYSSFIREGFDLEFIDISLKNLSMDLNKLEKYLKVNHNKVAAVFIICILGFSPDMEHLKKLEEKYKVEIFLDNCEGSNTKFNNRSINSYFTTSTSFYFSHIHTVGTEGGMIFTNNKNEFIYYMLTHHNGLVRVLEPYLVNGEAFHINELDSYDVIPKYNKDLKDSRFDFYQLGNNYRSSDINAFIGQLDFARTNEYDRRRKELYKLFVDKVTDFKCKLIYPQDGDVPFAIPIIINGKNKKERAARLGAAFEICNKLGIEYRSLVSGNVLRQRAFQDLGNASDFKIAEEIHNFGFYIGLNPSLKNEQVIEFSKELNEL